MVERKKEQEAYPRLNQNVHRPNRLSSHNHSPTLSVPTLSPTIATAATNGQPPNTLKSKTRRNLTSTSRKPSSEMTRPAPNYGGRPSGAASQLTHPTNLLSLCTQAHTLLLSFHTRAASHLRAAHHPVPASRLITPFTSTRTPSSFYLADPLNVYAHLGIPRPYVYLVGPRSVLHSKRGSQGDLCGTGVGLTLFCGWCCAQELAGR